MKKWSASRAPAGRIAYVNGRYLRHGVAGVHVEDRGLQLGEAVYEVCNVRRGRLIDEEAHLDRLERSLGELSMAMPMGAGGAEACDARNDRPQPHARRAALSSGLARRRQARSCPAPIDAPRPTLIITMRGQDIAALNRRMESGIAVATQPDIRWARRDIKTVQLLPNLMAKAAAKRDGAFEAWLVDDDGYVTEGASTNAWIVDGAGDVVTRDLSHAILPGVTRRIILEAAAAAGVAVKERKFTVAEARNAREAFISSATGAAVPVVSVDGVKVGDGLPGPITRRIHELYARKAGIES